MITIKYTEYHNDFFKRQLEKAFTSLDELADWIFNQMQTNYSDPKDGWVYMYFPCGKEASRIEFMPVRNGATYWIHCIENSDGVIFSDGRYTAEQKHWNADVKEWCKKCKERQYTPKFNFV